MKKIRITDAFEHFSSKHNDYKKLGEQICRQINDFLRQEKILSLNTDFRIKEKDKVIEKIKRKHYEDPINQIEEFEKEASLKHTRAGVFRIYLDLTNDEFYNNRKQFLKTFIDYEKRIKLYDKWRPIFKETLKA